MPLPSLFSSFMSMICCLSVYLPVCLSLSVYLRIYVCLFFCPSVRPAVCLSDRPHLPAFCLYICAGFQSSPQDLPLLFPAPTPTPENPRTSSMHLLTTLVLTFRMSHSLSFTFYPSPTVPPTPTTHLIGSSCSKLWMRNSRPYFRLHQHKIACKAALE